MGLKKLLTRAFLSCIIIFTAQQIQSSPRNLDCINKQVHTETIVIAGVAHPVERHLAKVEVASSSLVARSMFCPAALRRHSQVVRQGSAKPLCPGSNPGVASKKRACNRVGCRPFFFYDLHPPVDKPELKLSIILPITVVIHRVLFRGVAHRFRNQRKQQNSIALIDRDKRYLEHPFVAEIK